MLVDWRITHQKGRTKIDFGLISVHSSLVGCCVSGFPLLTGFKATMGVVMISGIKENDSIKVDFNGINGIWCLAVMCVGKNDAISLCIYLA